MIRYKELQMKAKEMNDIFSDLKKAINDEYNSFFMYSVGMGYCKNEMVKQEFMQHANEEHEHAQILFQIINDLGGKYFPCPESISYPKDCQYLRPSGDDVQKVKDNIKSEQCVIMSYTSLLKSYEWEPQHYAMIQKIINDEEEHIADLEKILPMVKMEKESKEMQEADSPYASTSSYAPESARLSSSKY